LSESESEIFTAPGLIRVEESPELNETSHSHSEVPPYSQGSESKI